MGLYGQSCQGAPSRAWTWGWCRTWAGWTRHGPQKLHPTRGSSSTPWRAAALMFSRSLPSWVTTPPGTSSVPTLVTAGNEAWGHRAPCPQPAPPWGHSCFGQGTTLLPPNPLNPQRSAPALWVLLPNTHSHAWVGIAGVRWLHPESPLALGTPCKRHLPSGHRDTREHQAFWRKAPCPCIPR